ncbi:hypothetical protein [Subtercola endophyticus]|uniref:hypothetical protein n=1 Tax=Subtercola endophyticus TaxID=2895559 RepID=UPI001E5F804F|nr:hypothetical protein [Subtercola endophyticus]UFS60548.1 hypothetical protein LQ955_07355 [Subtercola endophyticus]
MSALNETEQKRMAGWRPAAIVSVAAVALVAGLVAALPLFLTVMGAFQLSALARGGWDATWNDGDAGFTIAGAVALAVILGIAGIVGHGVGRAFHVPRAAALWMSLGGCLLVAGVIVVVVLSRLHF